MTIVTETSAGPLLETEASFQLLFHQHPLPMWVVENQSLAFLAVNEAAVQTYGFSREEFLAMTMDQIAEPEEEHAPSEVSEVSASPFWNEGRRSVGWKH